MRTPAACALSALLLTTAPHAQGESLIQFYDAALATNPAYRIREFSIDQARAQRDQTFSRLLPQISLSANYSKKQAYMLITALQESITSWYISKKPANS